MKKELPGCTVRASAEALPALASLPAPLRSAKGGVALVLSALLLAACGGPKPPARWAMGGARLDLQPAGWTYDGDPVEIRPLGWDYAEVRVDGDVELHLDRVGRVYDRYKRPIAMLDPDGRLVGVDNELLGIVGAANAALPGKAHAWLSFTPSGAVVKHDAEMGPVSVGGWVGCGPSPFAQQACLLVSYVLYFEDEGERTGERVPAGPSVGVGIGVGVGVGP
jgi:hypothetical protein